MAKPKFKVGQKVKCIRGVGTNLFDGKEYTVKRVWSGNDYTSYELEETGEYEWLEYRFVAVEEPAVAADIRQPAPLVVSFGVFNLDVDITNPDSRKGLDEILDAIYDGRLVAYKEKA